MKLIVGLGNPGLEYEKTRHNVGFDLVEALSEQYSISNFQFSKKFNTEIVKDTTFILAKPQTFMNDSGRAIRAVADYYNIDTADICVAHDDLDIRLGEYKIEFAHGPKIHNGINSVEQQLNTKDFWRVRIGVDNRTKEQRSHISGRDYVLMKMGREERATLDKIYPDIIDNLSVDFGIEYSV